MKLNLIQCGCMALVGMTGLARIVQMWSELLGEEGIITIPVILCLLFIIAYTVAICYGAVMIGIVWFNNATKQNKDMR